MASQIFETYYKTLQNAPHPVDIIIDWMRNTQMPDGIMVEEVAIRDTPAVWITPNSWHGGRVMVYFHGGGYTKGGIDTHLGLSAHLARATNAKTLLVDYRRAPDHPFPAAVDDCCRTLIWLFAKGFSAEKLIIAGDSAGGGLTMASLLKLKEQHYPMPAAAICLSPWVDLTNSGGSMNTRDKQDPWLNKEDLDECAAAYLPHQNLKTPLASPLFADLDGLPSTMILVGTREVLLDDSLRLAAKLDQAHVDTKLVVFEDMIHVWPLLVTRVPEADQAIAEIAAFLDEKMP